MAQDPRPLNLPDSPFADLPVEVAGRADPLAPGRRPSGDPLLDAALQAAMVVDLPNLGAVEVPADASMAELETFARGAGEEGMGPFLRGLREATIGVGSLDEVRQILQAIREQPSILLTGPLGQQQEQLRIAGEILEEPPSLMGGLEVVGRGMAGLIPLLGPAAAEAGTALARGDVSEGLGRTAGQMLPFGLRGLRRIRGKKPVGRVPATRGQRTGSAFLQKAEGFVEESIFGKGRFRAFRDRQRQAILGEVDRITTRLGRFRGTTEEFGQFVAQQMDEAFELRKAAAGGIYSRIDELTKAVVVKTGGLKKVARPILKRLDEEAALMAPSELAGARGILERVVKAPESVSFRAMADFRSDLLRVSRQIGDPLPGKKGGIAKALSKEADTALMAAASKSGVAELPEMVRRANQMWKDINLTFNEGFAKKILTDLPPERISDALVKADFESLTAMRRIVDRRTWNALKADFIDKQIVGRAAKGEELAPSMAHSVIDDFGVAPQSLVELSGAKFKAIVSGDGHVPIDRLQAIFSPKELFELQQLGEVAQTVGMTPRSIFSAMMDMQIMGGPALAIVAGGAPAAGAIGAGAAMGASVWGLSVLMTKPEGIRALRGFARAMGSRNAQQMTFWASRAAESLAESQRRERP